jgi:hypothetical protein
MESGTVLQGDTVLRANRPDVLDEVFDGEGVLVNLRLGTYYALNAPATDVWQALAPGRRPATVVSLLAERHAMAPDAVRALVGPFVAQLVDEQLLVPAEGRAAGPRALAGHRPSPRRTGPPALRGHAGSPPARPRA